MIRHDISKVVEIDLNMLLFFVRGDSYLLRIFIDIAWKIEIDE